MKIAYIDYNFHKKTKSNDFLKDYLSKYFEISFFWNDFGLEGNDIDIETINNLNFDAIIFFQYIPYYKKLQKIKCKNIIWFPMYDGDRNRNFFEWLSYLICGVKIVSFSSALSNKIKKYNFDILSLKYYPEPNFLEKTINIKSGLTIFFWQRLDCINWNLLKKIIKNIPIKNIVLRVVPDYDLKFIEPSKQDIQDYNIELITTWMDREEYIKKIQECDLYVAPRKYEGIGLSFLEAMSFGIPVITPDYPTMNEYINNENGFLYDFKNLKEINFSNINKIINNLKKDYLAGFNQWENQKFDIINFIEKNNNNEHRWCKNVLINILIESCYFFNRFYVVLKKLVKGIIK